MIGKLDPEERVMESVLPDWFAQTSDEPYDRHQYQVVFNNGQQSITFDDYEQMRAYWFKCVRNWKDCTINVLDRKQNKKSKGGFN